MGMYFALFFMTFVMDFFEKNVTRRAPPSRRYPHKHNENQRHEDE